MKTRTVCLVQAGTACLGVFAMVALAVADDGCLKRAPTLRIGVHTLDLIEKNPVCVKPNGNFIILLESVDGYPIERSKITVKAKGISKKIKDVKIENGNRLLIEVGNLAKNMDHEYKIKIKGVGVLDPRVRINDNAFAMTAEMQDIDVFTMNNYDISLLELMILDQQLRDQYHTNVSDIVEMLRATAESESTSE